MTLAEMILDCTWHCLKMRQTLKRELNTIVADLI